MSNFEYCKRMADVSFLENKKIALVSQGRVWSRYVSALLQEEDYDLTHFASGDELRRAFERSPFDYGLVILEANTPNWEVHQLLEMLRPASQERGLSVLVTLGRAGEGSLAALLREGADLVLTLPLEASEFLAHVEAIFRFKSRLRHSIEGNLARVVRKFETLQNEERLKRRDLHRDLIFSTTMGRVLVLSRSEFERYLTELNFEFSQPLENMRQVSSVRRLIEEDGLAHELPERSIEDLLLCTSELGSNVVKHGGGGQVSYGYSEREGAYILYFSDRGTGIDESFLLDALLYRGVSSKISMGLGFTLVLQICDELVMCTDLQGTQIIFKKKKYPSLEEEAAAEFKQALERF